MRSRLLPPSFLLALGAIAAQAQLSLLPIGATGRYETLSPQGLPSTPLVGGGFGVLWSEGDDGYRLDVRLQYVSAQGELRLGSQGVLVAGSDEFERGEALAPTPDGGVFAAYIGTLSHSAQTRIYLQRFDPAGNALWDEHGVVPIEGPGRDVQTEPRLLADGKGGVFVCLTHDDGSSGTSREIVCQHLGPDGGRLWGEAGRRGGGRSGAREGPGVVSDGKGGLLIFWVNRGDLFATGPAAPLWIEGQRFAADGRVLWGVGGKLVAATGLANTETTYPAALRAVPDGTGGAVLVYRGWSGRGAPSDDVLAVRVKNDGRLLWRRPTAIQDGPDDQSLTALLPTLDGGAIAVVAASWHDDAPLRLFRLAGNGRQRWAGGIPVTSQTGAGGQASARGAFDGQRLHLAWVERAGWPASRATALRLATFDANGRRAGEPTTLESLGDGSQDLADLRLDVAKRACLVLWDRADPLSNQGLDAVGALTPASGR